MLQRNSVGVGWYVGSERRGVREERMVFLVEGRNGLKVIETEGFNLK
jgi:hypothetical protein